MRSRRGKSRGPKVSQLSASAPGGARRNHAPGITRRDSGRVIPAWTLRHPTFAPDAALRPRPRRSLTAAVRAHFGLTQLALARLLVWLGASIGAGWLST